MLMSKLHNRSEGFRDNWNYDLAVKRLGLIQCKSEPLIETSPIYCCKFCPTPGLTSILAYAEEGGKIFILNTRNEEDLNRKNKTCDEIIASYEAHHNAIFDLAWSATSYNLVSVSGDHAAHLWDVKTQKCLAVFTNTKTIKTVKFEPESDTVFAVAGRAGNIYVCDVREDPAGSACQFIQSSIEISQPHGCVAASVKRKRQNHVLPPRAESMSVTDVCYQDKYHLISCADGDGIIKIWDLRNIRFRRFSTKPPQPCEILKHPGNTSNRGFTSLAIDPAGVRLYANCYDNHVYCYNISTYNSEPMCSYSGHDARSFSVKITLSPDGRYLLSGSKDSSAFIWRVDSSPWPIVTLPDHIGEVTAVAWSHDANPYFKVVACSDEPSPAIWRVETNISNKASDLTVIRTAQIFEAPESSKKPLPNLPLQYQQILKVQSSSKDSADNFSPTDCLPNFLLDKSHFLCREVKPRSPVIKRNWLSEITQSKQNATSSLNMIEKKPRKLKISNTKHTSKTPLGKMKVPLPKKSVRESKTSESHLSDSENSLEKLVDSPKLALSAANCSSITPLAMNLNLNFVTPDSKNSTNKERDSGSQLKTTPNLKVTPKNSSQKNRRRKDSSDSRQVNLLKYFQACSNP